MTPELEKLVISACGKNYAKPQKLRVAAIQIDGFTDPADLAKAIDDFCKENEGCSFENDVEYTEAYVLEGFSAYRYETEEETAARVEGYRRNAEQRLAAKRAEYEKMKAEFEPTITPDQETQ